MQNTYLAGASTCCHPWCLATWQSFGPWLSFIRAATRAVYRYGCPIMAEDGWSQTDNPCRVVIFLQQNSLGPGRTWPCTVRHGYSYETLIHLQYYITVFYRFYTCSGWHIYTTFEVSKYVDSETSTTYIYLKRKESLPKAQMMLFKSSRLSSSPSAEVLQELKIECNWVFSQLKSIVKEKLPMAQTMPFTHLLLSSHRCLLSSLSMWSLSASVLPHQVVVVDMQEPNIEHLVS